MTQAEFEHIAQSLRPLMIKIGKDYFGSDDDAEDVAQESLLQLWRYVEKNDSGRDLTRLAVRMAKHCCVDMERKRRAKMVRLNTDHCYDHDAGTCPSPHDTYLEQEGLILIEKVLNELNPRERELFEMRQIEGLSTADISRMTGVSRESVQSMVSRARKKVFEELKRLMNI